MKGNLHMASAWRVVHHTILKTKYGFVSLQLCIDKVTDLRLAERFEFFGSIHCWQWSSFQLSSSVLAKAQ